MRDDLVQWAVELYNSSKNVGDIFESTISRHLMT